MGWWRQWMSGWVCEIWIQKLQMWVRVTVWVGERDTRDTRRDLWAERTWTENG